MSLPLRPEVQALVRIRPDVDGLLMAYALALATVVCSVLQADTRACRRNHQVPRVPLPDVGVTSIRETCTVSSEDITPRSSLLQTHASIPCGSPLLRLLASFEKSLQVATSPCCYRDSPTLFCESFLRCPSPYPGGLLSAFAWFFPSSSAFPIIRLGRLPASFREHDFSRGGFRGCSYFIMFRPPSLLASQIVPTAAGSPAGQPRLFTSEQNVRRYLRTHRTCYPPDYRQLAERELSSRKIRSLVGCYRMMPTFPPSPLSFRTAGFPQYGWKAGISDKASKRGRPLRTVGPFSSDRQRDRIQLP